jgi:AbrB family looped-hinge helix DNA binding protein
MAPSNGTKLRIDRSGRIVVPKPLRERLGFKPGTELEAVDQAEGVLLRAGEQRPAMIRIEGLWVHRGVAEADTDWHRVIRDVREERSESVLTGKR